MKDTVREALEEYANPANWEDDANGIARVWREPGSSTPDTYDGFDMASKALTQPQPEAPEHWPRIQDTPEWQAAQEEPQPEAREEDIKLACDAEDALYWLIMVCTKPFKSGTNSERQEKQTRAVETIRKALSRLAAKEESEPIMPADPKNPCADCKNGIGPRPDAICDVCEGDESELPSMWEPSAPDSPEPRP